tara:strand:+ start:1075 stop:1623 length:549 start_codon:yes stop_codon:yes gene_type:complete
LIEYDENDIDLWNSITKTTKKIDSNNNLNRNLNFLRKKKQIVNKSPKIKLQNNLQKTNKDHTVTPIRFSKDSNSSGLSKRDIKEIRMGKFKVQSKLDLHGCRLEEAKSLFFEFLQKSFSSNKRNILIISGKGEHGKGKIRHSIPLWIVSPNLSPLIYFYSYAAPKDGGNGAYYIRLRKKEIS